MPRVKPENGEVSPQRRLPKGEAMARDCEVDGPPIDQHQSPLHHVMCPGPTSAPS